MKQSFLVQRFHPNLRIGFVPSVLSGKRCMPIHCQQGWWDSACGAYCAAMALTLLGEIHDVIMLSERRHGVAARLWRAAQANYFEGMDPAQLAAMLHSVGTNRTITYCTGRQAKCLAFALAELKAGHLVIASWRSHKGNRHHWILILGIEGIQKGHSFTPATLLALDPGAGTPQLCGYNGRLEFSVPLRGRPGYHRYFSSDGYELAVKLTGAVSIGAAAQQREDS